jgi:hypothetical protein
MSECLTCGNDDDLKLVFCSKCGHDYCSKGCIVAHENQCTAVREDTICGLCGRPWADKIPHPVYWPGEQEPGTQLVHSECEDAECQRAHAALSDREREEFLRRL